jgi:hypothetical protein
MYRFDKVKQKCVAGIYGFACSNLLNYLAQNDLFTKIGSILSAITTAVV